MVGGTGVESGGVQSRVVEIARFAKLDEQCCLDSCVNWEQVNCVLNG